MPAPHTAPDTDTDTGVIVRNSSNLHAQDYAADAGTLGPPLVPITDVHSHINGTRAAAMFAEVAELYGVERIYSMTRPEHVDGVREILGDRIRFIAIPDFRAEDKAHAFGRGFVDSIETFHARGARITKFWVAPRSRDIAAELGDFQLFRLDSPYTREAIARSRDLGMMFMVHVADPDTWFAAKYADTTKYGTKRSQYEPLEHLLSEHRDVPWIAAHMGGWPEDLEFLTALLARHPNLYLDTSAAKWILREVSRFSRDEVVTFLRAHMGRIMFGSDIVTTDEHLKDDDDNEMSKKAGSAQEAYDLYASRYWALRTMWETSYDGASPIADPDLHLVEPARYTELDSPPLRGHALPPAILRSLYRDASSALLDPYYT
jgi:hypothetical protein